MLEKRALNGISGRAYAVRNYTPRQYYCNGRLIVPIRAETDRRRSVATGINNG